MTEETNKSLIEFYGNLNHLKVEEGLLKLQATEHKGREICSKNEAFKDLATVMEHPEFYKFYYKYMRDWNKLKKMIIYMHIYDIISKYMYMRDPTESSHNAYNKLALLWIILKNSSYIKQLFRRVGYQKSSCDIALLTEK